MEQENQTKPVEENIVEKKSNWWKWLLGSLIVVAIAVVIYILIGDSSSVPSLGNSIPQPPALPN